MGFIGGKGPSFGSGGAEQPQSTKSAGNPAGRFANGPSDRLDAVDRDIAEFSGFAKSEPYFSGHSPVQFGRIGENPADPLPDSVR